MRKKSKLKTAHFKEELESYIREGIPLWLNGHPSTPEEIIHAHLVAEDITYMRDYVQDARGRLTRLEFDQVDVSDIRMK